MTIETKLRGGLVLSILILLWSTIMWNNDIDKVNKQNMEISKLKLLLSKSRQLLHL